jgi:hypothetical protein
MIGVDSQCLGKFAFGIPPPTLFFKLKGKPIVGRRHIVPRIALLRIDPHGIGKMSDRAAEIPLSRERGAEVVVRLGILGP